MTDSVTDSAASEPGKPPRRDYTRLSVNISHEAADAVRKIADDHGWSVTETIRRLIAIGKFTYDEEAKGGRLCVRHGDEIREVVVL